ncbi:MAG: AbgT family transporter [Opitutaceae bacterium]|nr:AbgT family transporter [Opitutaceae bacterium]
MIATMLPYSIAFIISWTGLLILWILLQLPMGPGSGLFLNR